MTTLIIWGAALLLYIGFRLFYDNWRGPLRAAEIEQYKAVLKDADYISDQEKANITTFMEQDDGKEFFMFNIGRLHKGKVTNPTTGEEMSASKLLQQYSKPFIGKLFGRAGHPYFMQGKVAGYIDSWNEDGSFPDEIDWNFVNAMRYRSRRDLMEMVVETNDAQTHQFKRLGLAETFNFPVQPMMRGHLGPRAAVFLILLLGASLLTNLIG